METYDLDPNSHGPSNEENVPTGAFDPSPWPGTCPVCGSRLVNNRCPDCADFEP